MLYPHTNAICVLKLETKTIEIKKSSYYAYRGFAYSETLSKGILRIILE